MADLPSRVPADLSAETGAAQGFVLITGASGGGKSTLLSELGRRGCATVPEPGPTTAAAALGGGGGALPWEDPAGFARAALALARDDLARARGLAPVVVFDRGLIDAAVALRHHEGVPLTESLGGSSPYARRVFLAPPWPAIFAPDPERRHGLPEAVAEYARIRAALAELGHEVVELPRLPVSERADFACARLPGARA